MTALVFLVTLFLAWAHWLTLGYFVVDGVTIYVFAFIITLSFAIFRAFTSGDDVTKLSALVLAVSFIGNNLAWQTDWPIFLSAMVDLTTATILIVASDRELETVIGSVFIVSFLVSMLAALGIIPDHLSRPDVFIAWSQPDLTAICGHLASIILGAGAGDCGKRIKHTLVDFRRSGSLGPALGGGVIVSRDPSKEMQSQEER